MFIRSAAVKRLATTALARRPTIHAGSTRASFVGGGLAALSFGDATRVNLGRGLSTATAAASSTLSTPSLAPDYPVPAVAAALPTAPPAQQVGAFPSLLLRPHRAVVPQGPFAEAQAAFLEPPARVVEDLLERLLALNVGIVAHYYMDVELQGVLHAVKNRQMRLLARQRRADEAGAAPGARRIPAYPLVSISDSLKMGDDAVEMCSQNGVGAVLCLGVDFMSESVAAIMGKNGFGHVPVYRATHKHIGCSLAESAEGDSYRAWLAKSAASDLKSLHVVYINTSLETKAVASSIIPTITCTSSNVLNTILQASVQMGPEDLQVCYGPDTYMGDNLVALLTAVLDSGWSDARIAADLHPQHDRATIRSLRDNINVYPAGNCVVHHMFGRSVVDTVLCDYSDAYVTAHLEVPGEMFQIALRKSLDDEGVVGSTSNILHFIERKVEAAAREGAAGPRRLTFVLGTEAGMVTAIVKSVQGILDAHANGNVEAEIVFPVSAEAVASADGIEVVPGVAGGEGCSTAGGCATCPFMKMNDLDAVQDIIDALAVPGHEMRLAKHLPPGGLANKKIGGRDAIEMGTEPIMYMREFMKTNRISDELVEKVEAAVDQGSRIAA